MDTRLSQIERELSTHDAMLTHQSATLEKLVEVSANISKLLAVQDKRVETAEKSLDKLELIVEKQRSDFESKLDKAANSTILIESNLKNQMDVHYKQICQKLDSFQEDFDDYKEKQETKISGIERWIWLAIGGAAVIGFLTNIVIGII